MEGQVILAQVQGNPEYPAGNPVRIEERDAEQEKASAIVHPPEHCKVQVCIGLGVGSLPRKHQTGAGQLNKQDKLDDVLQ